MPTRNPHILYVTEALYRAGTEGHLATVAPAMRARGWDVSIFCLSDVGPLASGLERKGVRVIGPPLRQLSKRSFLFVLRIGLAALKLFWTLLRRRPLIVHFFLPGPYIVGAPVALLAGVPVRIMSRRSLNRYQSAWPLARRVEPILHRHMTEILANSQSIVRELTEEEGCDPKRVSIIYNGVDVARFDSAEAAKLESLIGKARPRLVLITVANLIPYKGHADLLEALAGIKAKLPQPWTLLCAGRDTGIEEALRRQASRLGLNENVEFLGEKANVASLLKASDIALLCSHQEGFPNVILEAMAAKLPVIATDVGGTSEAVAANKTGLIVPPHDPTRLGAAILELATDARRCEAMGRAGYERAVEKFTIEACIDNYARLYDRLTQH